MNKTHNPNDHGGHRRRIIEKLKRENLTEHEQLEILLFNAVPRRNTNDMAHRLLSRFGGITNLFSASMDELLTVDGIGESVASYLYCIGRFFNAYHKTQEESYSGQYTHASFETYLQQRKTFPQEETVEVYFLDENGYTINRYDFYGDGHGTWVRPEILAKLLVEYAPAGIILVHNHPMGKPTPSQKDEEMTRQCQLLCSSHNVILCDHLIYAKEGVYSYYASGKLRDISKEYSLKTILGNK